MKMTFNVRSCRPLVTGALLLLTVASVGCNKSAGVTPVDLQSQQKGVMGGTPPPGAQAQIQAERQAAQQRMAAGQAQSRK